MAAVVSPLVDECVAVAQASRHALSNSRIARTSLGAKPQGLRQLAGRDFGRSSHLSQQPAVLRGTGLAIARRDSNGLATWPT